MSTIHFLKIFLLFFKCKFILFISMCLNTICHVPYGLLFKPIPSGWLHIPVSITQYSKPISTLGFVCKAGKKVVLFPKPEAKMSQ